MKDQDSACETKTDTSASIEGKDFTLRGQLDSVDLCSK